MKSSTLIRYLSSEFRQNGRFGAGATAVIVLFFFFLDAAFAVNSIEDAFLQHPVYADMNPVPLLIGITIFLVMLNRRLFFIREQDESVFLISKFRFVPADIRKIFLSKALFLFLFFLLLLIFGMAVYYMLVIGCVKQSCDLIRPLFFFLQMGLFGVCVAAILLLYDAVHIRQD